MLLLAVRPIVLIIDDVELPNNQAPGGDLSA